MSVRKSASFAAPIFNIRPWLARNRLTPNARSCGISTDCVREPDSVERIPTGECDPRHTLAGSGNPADRRSVDADRRNLHSPD